MGIELTRGHTALNRLMKQKICRAIPQIAQNETANGEMYRRFITGDRDALTALVDLYGEDLTRFISRIVGNHHDAEELMIDAFTQLVRNKDRIRNHNSLKSYLFTSGKNLALNYLKKNKRSPVIFEYIDNVLEEAGKDNAPDTELFRQEQKRQLDLAMARLKQPHREALQLIYFENKNYADAGKAMNKTVKQIDNLLYNAKAALKKSLEIEDFLYETDQ